MSKERPATSQAIVCKSLQISHLSADPSSGRIGQCEEFFARLFVRSEQPADSAREGLGVLRFPPPHHHAQMVGLDHHADALRLEHGVEGAGDLLSEPLLYLEPP